MHCIDHVVFEIPCSDSNILHSGTYVLDCCINSSCTFGLGSYMYVVQLLLQLFILSNCLSGCV